MLNFDRLWAAYPTQYTPCATEDGRPHFPNQCAIRFGIALFGGGVDISSFPGVLCWHQHAEPHLLRGEEIAAWMRSKPKMFGKCSIYTNADSSTFEGRRGLVFCRNFWGPGSQGDHIDLWNRDYMATGNPEYITRSQEVWFWEIDAQTLSWIDSKQNNIKRKTAKPK